MFCEILNDIQNFSHQPYHYVIIFIQITAHIHTIIQCFLYILMGLVYICLAMIKGIILFTNLHKAAVLSQLRKLGKKRTTHMMQPLSEQVDPNEHKNYQKNVKLT